MVEKQKLPDLLPQVEWDPIIFARELIRNEFFPRKPAPLSGKKSRSGIIQPPAFPAQTTQGFKEGTTNGTRKALNAAYAGLLQSFTSFFDIAGFETSIPRGRTSLQEAKELYNWTDTDDFPPHLAVIPSANSQNLLQIFDALRLADSGVLLSQIVPTKILDWINGDPDTGVTMQAATYHNQELRKEGFGLFASPNIGDRDDWFTDAVFAMQQLIGTNPVTLELASETWMEAFIGAADAQTNQEATDILSGRARDSSLRDSFYVQDYSHFRRAVSMGPRDTIQSEKGERKGCAPVALFRLTGSDGVLHPIAIILDYKESAEHSVTIFNRRLRASDDRSTEATDWPWRYAKTCVQTADWFRHEVGVHLTEAHFVEEATIVAANRAFPETHIVYRLLEPHWLKTLSLNAAARSTLVPYVVVPLTPFTKDQILQFTRTTFSEFDWVGRYVPNDLERRGFPVKELNDVKFHNCGYARDMYLFWQILRKFVSAVLKSVYISDDQLSCDDSVSQWCHEMQNPLGASMTNFPTITTVDGLIDAVTACIHIASPFHSAINYLQNYYYAFVINKPPSLFKDLPTTLAQLEAMTESDLIASLPLDHPQDWLLASHIPWLLSYRVAQDENILTWAASLHNVAVLNPDDHVIATASRELYSDLIYLGKIVQRNSDALDEKATPYTVLQPEQVAVSILI